VKALVAELLDQVHEQNDLVQGLTERSVLGICGG
jgi:hypothetical protein